MYQVRYPAEILDCLKDSSDEEDTSIRIVARRTLGGWPEEALAPEEVWVVDEVHLYARRGYRGDLDDEWVVVVIDDDVDTR